MLAILFLLLPLFELVVLIKIGGVIGALPAIMGALATSVLGATLLRRKGLRTLLTMQSLAEGDAGADAKLATELAATLGAALLLFPGYVSDAIGLLLFVPGLGAWALRLITQGGRWTVLANRSRRTERPMQRSGRIIEGEVTHPTPRRDWSDEA